MVDNPAIHELNNIEVRGGDTDFQVVNIAGSSEDILLEYNDDTEEWDIRGTVSDLDVADLEYEFGLHQTEIDEDKQIPEGQGSVIAGPLTGTGEITGEGNLAVVDDVQDAVRNPVQENVDFNSNNATGISALEADSVNVENLGIGADNNQVDYFRQLITSDYDVYDDTEDEGIDHDFIEITDPNFPDARAETYAEGERVRYLEFSIQNGDVGEIELRTNRAPDGNENALYFDKSGTQNANADGFLVADVATSFESGVVYSAFLSAWRGSTQVAPDKRLYRYGEVADWGIGGEAGNPVDDSIQIIGKGGFGDIEYVNLYEVGRKT